MYKLFVFVFLVPIINCQLALDDDDSRANPATYRLLRKIEEQEDITKEEQYSRFVRRGGQIPVSAYKYDEGLEDDYGRDEPQTRQKYYPDNSRYKTQTKAPSHKDYEEILRRNHLARLMVAAKKQPSQTVHQSQPVEQQYLKEVNPTTKTNYERPNNYNLWINGQSTVLKQEQNDETQSNVPKHQPFGYILQSPLREKQYPQSQYPEETQEPSKPAPPKTVPFNLVAYQNALIAQQKLIAAANEEETPKSSIYVSQNVPKKTKKQKTRTNVYQQQEFELFPQTTPQQQVYSQGNVDSLEYQQYVPSRTSQKSENNYGIEDPLDPEYQTTAPIKPKEKTPAAPERKSKFRGEDLREDYQLTKSQSEEEQYEDSGIEKYQNDYRAVNYKRPTPLAKPKYVAPVEENTKPNTDYVRYQIPTRRLQPEQLHRRQPQEPETLRQQPNKYLTRQQYQEETKQLAHEQETIRQQLPKQYLTRQQYQEETKQLAQEQENIRQPLPTKYVTRQQYQEESKQLSQYQGRDLFHQPSSEYPISYRGGRGPSLVYGQEAPSSVRYFRNLDSTGSYVE